MVTVTSILEKELSVALGMSVPLLQLETKHQKEQDALKSRMLDEIRGGTGGEKE